MSGIPWKDTTPEIPATAAILEPYTAAEIADLIEKMYGHHYSRGAISNMAANIQAEVEAFHKRPLEKHGKRYPKLAEKFSDRRSLFSFYSYSNEIQQSLYTTNLVENMNKQLKRTTKRKEQFPNEEALNRCAYCHYSAQNARFATKAHRGFGQCQYELEKLFEERFLTSTPSGTSAA